ncbi:hypothetical protein IAU60_003660 [Kwoniella sp. DSM 27419]
MSLIMDRSPRVRRPPPVFGNMTSSDQVFGSDDEDFGTSDSLSVSDGNEPEFDGDKAMEEGESADGISEGDDEANSDDDSKVSLTRKWKKPLAKSESTKNATHRLKGPLESGEVARTSGNPTKAAFAAGRKLTPLPPLKKATKKVNIKPASSKGHRGSTTVASSEAEEPDSTPIETAVVELVGEGSLRSQSPPAAGEILSGESVADDLIVVTVEGRAESDLNIESMSSKDEADGKKPDEVGQQGVKPSKTKMVEKPKVSLAKVLPKSNLASPKGAKNKSPPKPAKYRIALEPADAPATVPNEALTVKPRFIGLQPKKGIESQLPVSHHTDAEGSCDRGEVEQPKEEGCKSPADDAEDSPSCKRKRSISTPCPDTAPGSSPRKLAPAQKIPSNVRGDIVSGFLHPNYLKLLSFAPIETPNCKSAKLARHWREVLGPDVRNFVSPGLSGSSNKKSKSASGKNAIDSPTRARIWHVVCEQYETADWKSIEESSGISTTKLKRHLRDVMVKEVKKYIEG